MHKVDLKELAEKLNLSISTVSRALRDRYDISTRTKQRVMALAAELNYQPNPYASSLRQRKSKTIGVVIPEIANNFFTLAINGIESVAQENGYHVLIYITHEDPEKEANIIRHIRNGRVDGLLMSVSGNMDPVRDLKENGLPLVLFDRVSEDPHIPSVTTDDYQGGFDATSHLIESGCRNIAYLAVSKNLSINHKRMKGYQDALKKHSIPYKDQLVINCGNDDAENLRKIGTLLQGRRRPDGVFASVEKLAVSTYEAARNCGLEIPKDLKLVGFSNMAVASILNPALTTITQPAYEIGKEAASMLFHILEQQEKKKTELSSVSKVFRSELIKRDSSR